MPDSRNPVPFFDVDQALVDNLCDIIRVLGEASKKCLIPEECLDGPQYTMYLRLIGE